MPHLLKEYSKNLGVEPSKIIVNKHFYPISCDNFIVIYNEQKTNSKTYRYYSLVVDILSSVLKKYNIEVVVIGSDVNASNRADHIYPNLSFKENAYIISKSKLTEITLSISNIIFNIKKKKEKNWENRQFGRFYNSTRSKVCGKNDWCRKDFFFYSLP